MCSFMARVIAGTSALFDSLRRTPRNHDLSFASCPWANRSVFLANSVPRRPEIRERRLEIAQSGNLNDRTLGPTQGHPPRRTLPLMALSRTRHETHLYC